MSDEIQPAPPPWQCPKCDSRNGAFDQKCWHCGKRQPLSAIPPRTLVEAHAEFRGMERAKQAAELNRIGNRPGRAFLAGMSAAILTGLGWFFGNTGPAGPSIILSTLVASLYGGAIGAAVWAFGRGFHWKYGAWSALCSLASTVISEAMIGTFYLALEDGVQPAVYLASGSLAVYFDGWRFLLGPFQFIFYLIAVVSAFWFGWRSYPGDSRFAQFF